MKKRMFSILLTGALCLSAAMICPVTAGAAQIDDAYRAYYDFLQEELDSPANEKVCYAKLIDFDQNGIPELVYGNDLNSTDLSEITWIDSVYAYRNGQVVRLSDENITVERDYSGGDRFTYDMTTSTGSDGRIYAIRHRFGAGTYMGGDDFYSVVNGKWQLIAQFDMDFDPDIYISPDVYSSTGEMHYLYGTGGEMTELPHATWYARLQAMTSGGETKHDLRNTVQPTLNELAKRVDADYVSHYRTPSSWAASAVNQGIERDLVPKTLQKKYNTPITRKEFCALAVALYEDASGYTLGTKAEFTDTNDENVRKMGALGVIQGTGGGKFEPDRQLTREEAAVILTNLSRAMGTDLPQAAPAFTDNSKISSWARQQVGQVQAAGIMNGIEGGQFAPQDPYTREQSIVTMLRLEEVAVVEPTRLELTPEDESIRVSSTTTVNHKVYPENATNQTIASWKSSDEHIATVNSLGIVTGKSVGDVTITATTPNGVSGSCTITILPEHKLTSLKTERLPVTVNCLYLDGESWEDQDVDFVPDDAMIAAKLRITNVEPSSYSSSMLTAIEVSGEVASLNEDFRFDYEPYLKYDIEDADGRIVQSGIVTASYGLYSEGDSFSVLIYLDNADLDAEYTISFRNDSGKNADEVIDEAPEIELPDLPFSVTDEDGYTTTIEDVNVEFSYSTRTGAYEADISFVGTAEVQYFTGAKFVWELQDSSGNVVTDGTDYVTSTDIADDGSFVLGPHYSGKGIDLENGEQYTLYLRTES